MVDLASSRVYSSLDHLRAQSIEVDAGMSQARMDVGRLRAELHVRTPPVPRIQADITEIRGTIGTLSGTVAAFRGAAAEVRSALRATDTSYGAKGNSLFDPAIVQAQAAADAATRQAIDAEAGVTSLTTDLSGLARQVRGT